MAEAVTLRGRGCHPTWKVRKLERHVEAAKKASFAREFTAAVQEYTHALEVADAPPHAPLAANMHAERAAARVRLHEYEEALKDCAIALYAQAWPW